MNLIYALLSTGIVLFLFSFIPASYAQTIPITNSPDMDKVILDGKWSFSQEWKPSTLTTIDTPSGSFYIRAAHHGDYIYIFVDSAFDTHPVLGADRATVCFDSDNDKSSNNDSNDYCFTSTLGQNSTLVLQGGSPIAISDYFKKISISNYVGVGGISGTYDVYGSKPHPSFEFKIPVDLLGRTSSYGFFAQFYDGRLNQYYSWPQDPNGGFYSHIPSPSKWGDIISPDHTLPEFNIPIILLVLSFLMVIYLSKHKSLFLK